MKRKTFIFIIMGIVFLCQIGFGGDVPIIFVNGISDKHDPKEGFKTCNHPSSAAQRIINEQYGGYTKGLNTEGNWDCDEKSTLQPMTDTKKIYNFSFYHHDKTRGVIGSNGKYLPVDFRNDYIASLNHETEWPEKPANFTDPIQKRFKIGISYSPALCIRGDNLTKQIPPGQEFSFDPFRNLYLMHMISLEFCYTFNSDLQIELAPVYFWGKMSETTKITAMLKPSGEPYEEPWIHVNLHWDISGIAFAPIIRYTFMEDRYIKFGLEFYHSNGKDHELAYRYDHELKRDVIQPIDASNRGRGLGIFLQTGLLHKITKELICDLSCGIRAGKSWEYHYKVPENTIWGGPVNLSFTGIFIKLGINYKLF